MHNLFPKLTAILFGAVFLLGGASMAGAQEASVIYFYKFKTNSAESTPFQFKDFSTAADCNTSRSTAPTYGLSPCVGTTVAGLNALKQAEQQRMSSLEARARSAEENALFKKLNCNPVGSIIGGVFGGEGTLAECVPVVTYYVIYKPASWLLIGSGFIFDAMLTLSIDSSFVNQEFVVSTWSVVRDFSNMLFIFILLYTGVQTVLGIGNWRKTVLMVIVMALLINFSLFFTKVVIDAGNVLAVGIYNSMGTEKPTEFQSFQSPGKVHERDISGSLAGAFHPEKFLKVSGDVDALDATIVFLIAAIVSGYAGYIFFKAALLFIGRLVAFWFLMIVSPFAFISIALPAGANKFQSWLDELISQAFMAPVFLFLIYLIMKVISAGDGILGALVKQSGSSVGAFTFDKVLAPVIIAAILMFALEQAFGFAKKMSGAFGEFGSSLGGAVMGIAGAGLVGGAARAGRVAIGGTAQRILDSDRLQGLAASKNTWARATGITTLAQGGVLAANKAKDATYDVRNIGGAIGKGIGTLGMGKGGKLNYEKEEEAFVKEQKKRAAMFEVGSGAAQKVTVEKTKETVKETKETVKELKEVRTKASEELKKATTKDTEMRSSGTFDEGVKRVLDEAKRKDKEAQERLEEAEKKAVEAELAEKEASKVLNTEDERRRGVQGKQAAFFHKPFSSEERKKIRAKIREGKTSKEKDDEDIAKTLKKLAEKLPKDEKEKEEKKETSGH
ncbi:MAG: hypothetical protein M0P64_01155 [Candidatus Pacebacteria bacterium]|jgi:hypothetical protein|nr:hypothetical protein [Candidatus Paceibacterota bacterium]